MNKELIQLFTMEKKEILGKLQDIYQDVLDDENIILTFETTADDIEEWDSLSHVQLIITIEKEFGIHFSSSEIQGIRNVGHIVEIISQKK